MEREVLALPAADGFRRAHLIVPMREQAANILQSPAIPRPKLAASSLQGVCPLLYEAHRRNIASI
jgi:hypothetical protein